jgi:hypothetical protein
MGNEKTKLLSEWTFGCKKSCPKKDYLKIAAETLSYWFSFPRNYELRITNCELRIGSINPNLKHSAIASVCMIILPYSPPFVNRRPEKGDEQPEKALAGAEKPWQNARKCSWGVVSKIQNNDFEKVFTNPLHI